MPAFSEVAAQKPSAFVVVPPTAFRADWDARPRDKVAVGLRLISAADVETARAVARKTANDAHPDTNTSADHDLRLWADAYNDALLAHIVACGTCDPNDTMEPWPLVKAAPEDMVREYVTPDGLRLIYDAWERMRIASDPTQAEATDEDVARLPALLAERSESLGRVKRMRVRRLLAFVLSELEPPPAAPVTP